MQIRKEYLFPILKFTHQRIFRQRIRGRVNCGRELKRSVLCLAPDTIQLVLLTRISGYLFMLLIIQRETQCYCFSSLQKFFVTIKSYILNCTSRTFSLLLPVVDFFLYLSSRPTRTQSPPQSSFPHKGRSQNCNHWVEIGTRTVNDKGHEIMGYDT